MARQRKPSASDVMRRLKFDPLKLLVRRACELDDRREAGELEEGEFQELLALSRDLLPYAYAKLKPKDEGEAPARSFTVVIGGDEP